MLNSFHENIVSTLVSIENKFDVNTLLYKKKIVWPLIRLAILRQMRNPDLNYLNKEAKLSEYAPQLRLNPKHALKNSVDILFFSRVEEHKEKLLKKYYNPFIDPVIELAKQKYKLLKLELKTSHSTESLPRFEYTEFIEPDPVEYIKESESAIENFSEFKKMLKLSFNLEINEIVFIQEARSINAWQIFFGQVLTLIKPRAVFLVCYSYLIAMALIKAAKAAKIKTVDIQHGIFGADYTHWSRIPKSGSYELLPDFFWCWGKKSKECIDNYMYPEDHKAVVGGNLYISRQMGKNKKTVTRSSQNFFLNLKKYKKVILITMTKHDIEMSVPLIYAIQRSPIEWLWLIRLHPDYKTQEEMIKIKLLMKQYEIENFEIEHATSENLCSLLKIADHHITAYSSTCYEAMAFNVPTTIVHSTGCFLYGDEIKNGVLSYAQTTEEILASILRYNSVQFKINVSDYVETKKSIAKNALKYIMDSSSNNFSQVEN